MVIYKIYVFGADRKFNMAARAHNVFWLVEPIRTHYWPWQPCGISDLHQNNKSGRGPPNEHFCQVWSKSVQWFHSIMCSDWSKL
jgi:hypothetical protein